MKRSLTILSIIISALIFVACEENQTSKKGPFDHIPLKDVDTVANIDFVATLDGKLDKKVNTFYTPTLAYAWHQIDDSIGKMKNITSAELKQIHRYKLHESALNHNEINYSYQLSENKIKSSSSFEKMLPLKKPLLPREYPLHFNDNKVKQFGCNGFNEQVKIAYYKNENNFSIVLQPTDSMHEIVLMTEKGNSLYKNWKYFQRNRNKKATFLDRIDVFNAPVLELNLLKNYNEIIGSQVTDRNDIDWDIVKCYQDIAFILDENGAKVKSEAIITEKSKDESEEEPEPKYFVFDQPFIVFLKRKDKKHPYFAGYFCDAKMMQPFD